MEEGLLGDVTLMRVETPITAPQLDGYQITLRPSGHGGGAMMDLGLTPCI